MSIPGKGKIRSIILNSKERGGRILKKFCKIAELQPWRRFRDLLLSPTHKYLDERSVRECFFAAFLLIFSWLFKPNLIITGLLL